MVHLGPNNVADRITWSIQDQNKTSQAQILFIYTFHMSLHLPDSPTLGPSVNKLSLRTVDVDLTIESCVFFLPTLLSINGNFLTACKSYTRLSSLLIEPRAVP